MSVITPRPRRRLVDTRSPEFRARLDAALDRIGHQGSPEFRDRLATAFNQPEAIDAVNVAIGELELILEPGDPRRRGLRLIQGGLDDLWAAELDRAQVA